jgi:cytochrome o ubiquinol oxidase subunit 3
MTADAFVAAAGGNGDEPATPDVYEQRAFGFWLYLMSDAIIFSLLFATYAVMARNNAGGPTGNTLFSLPNAFAETMLLLFSSITFGLATLAMKSGEKERMLSWLLVTFLLGLGFVGLEIREFHGMVRAGAGPDRSGFLSAFFTLVGTHGLHVTFGLIWLVVLMVQVGRGGLLPENKRRLMCLSMFWHFLDVVWIGVFTFVYLMGVL